MNRKFKIKIKNSPLPEEETRQLLWKCLDLLFANAAKRKKQKPHNKHDEARHNISLLTNALPKNKIKT